MGATGLVTFWNKNRRGLGCAGTSGRIGGIIFLFSWTSPIGFTLDFDNDRAFNEAVQESHGQWRIGKIVGPSVEVNVGEQSGGTALVASDVVVTRARPTYRTPSAMSRPSWLSPTVLVACSDACMRSGSAVPPLL